MLPFLIKVYPVEIFTRVTPGSSLVLHKNDLTVFIKMNGCLTILHRKLISFCSTDVASEFKRQDFDVEYWIWKSPCLNVLGAYWSACYSPLKFDPVKQSFN